MLPEAGGGAALDSLSEAIAATDGVATVGQPVLNAAKDTATLTVFPTTKPQAAATTDLLHHLRGDVVRPVEQAARPPRSTPPDDTMPPVPPIARGAGAHIPRTRREHPPS